MAIDVVPLGAAGVAVREPVSHEVTVFFRESSKRVLWIEADKKFVDILLNFLLLPVGAAVQAVSRQGKGHPDPNIGGLGNIFCNIEVPGMQGKVPTSELEAKLLNPPTVLGNDKRLESAYACATMSLRRECGLCQTGTWSWESLWDDRITATRFQGGYDASSCSMCKRDMKIMDSPGTRLQEMAEWHTYIVTEKLEVHPSSVAKGMDLLGELPFTKRNDQVLKKKCVVGKHEVLQLLRASLTEASPLNEVFSLDDSSKIESQFPSYRRM